MGEGREGKMRRSIRETQEKENRGEIIGTLYTISSVILTVAITIKRVKSQRYQLFIVHEGEYLLPKLDCLDDFFVFPFPFILDHSSISTTVPWIE